jgi:hypothetical protein
MASTRAKARALRDLTNIGMTALEELGDFSEVIGAEETEQKRSQPRKDNVKKFTQKQGGNGDGRIPEGDNPIPHQDQTETAVQTNPPVLPPKEDPAKKMEGQRADTKPERAPKAKTVKSGNGKDKIPMMSEAQKSAIYNLSRRRGISVEELENMSQKTFNVPVENLSHENAVSFIRTLQQAA